MTGHGSFADCSRCTHAVAQEASTVYAVCFSHCCDRVFDNSSFGKEGSTLAHGVRISSIMARKMATANTGVGFPSSVKLSGPNQNYSESLEKTAQIKWAVMRTLWSFFFFCSVFFKGFFFLCFVVAACSMTANSWMRIIPRSLCVKGLFTPRWCFWELEPLGSGA